MKKILLSLGSTFAIIAPVATIVSCGEKTIELDLSKIQKDPKGTLAKLEEFQKRINAIQDAIKNGKKGDNVNFKITSVKGETKTFSYKGEKEVISKLSAFFARCSRDAMLFLKS